MAHCGHQIWNATATESAVFICMSSNYPVVTSAVPKDPRNTYVNVQLLKPKMKALNLSWHCSDSLLSSCLLTLTVTSVKVFTIAEFGHYWWQLSRQRVLTGHSCDISHPLSLLTFFFPFSSYQMDTAAVEKSIYGHWVPIWSFKNRERGRSMGVEAAWRASKCF